MNALTAQLRTGGMNFADLISRSVRNASASSPVVFWMTLVETTFPLVSTVASTTTRPCFAESERFGVGVVANAKSESAGQPPRFLAVGFCPSRSRKRDAAHPV